MNKEQKAVLIEYVSSLPESDMMYIGMKLHQRLQGDMAEVINIISRDPKVDEMLATTETADELYDVCDCLGEIITKEGKKKGLMPTVKT